MAICIPSKSIYAIENSKIKQNYIDGLSIEQFYKDAKTVEDNNAVQITIDENLYYKEVQETPILQPRKRMIAKYSKPTTIEIPRVNVENTPITRIGTLKFSTKEFLHYGYELKALYEIYSGSLKATKTEDGALKILNRSREILEGSDSRWFTPSTNPSGYALTDNSSFSEDNIDDRHIDYIGLNNVSFLSEVEEVTLDVSPSIGQVVNGTYVKFKALSLNLKIAAEKTSYSLSSNKAFFGEIGSDIKEFNGNGFFRSDTLCSRFAILEFLGETYFRYHCGNIEYDELEKEVLQYKEETFVFDKYTEDENVVSFSGNTKAFSVGNKYAFNTIKLSSAADILSTSILRQYKDGKETATIYCAIADYYLFSPKEKGFLGNKSISIGGDENPMLFNVGDQVIPLVRTVVQDEGNKDIYYTYDIPMAIESADKENDYAKVFDIVDVGWVYDGVLLQKISIQENGRKVKYPKMTYDELLQMAEIAVDRAEIAEENLERIEKYYSALPQGGVNEFWESFQNGGYGKDYSCSFGAAWTEKTLTPKYNIYPKNLYMGFAYNKIENLAEHFEKLGVKLNTTAATSMSHAFFYCETKRLPEIDTRATHTLTSTFYYCKNLEKIDKLILLHTGTQTFSLVFHKCYELKDIVIEGAIGQDGWDMSYCSKLSKESLTNIIYAIYLYSNPEETKTITLSKTAVENAFTETEWEDLVSFVYDYGWEVSLIDGK